MIERCLKVFLTAAAIALAAPAINPAASLATAQERPDGCVPESWPAFPGPGPGRWPARWRT